MTGRYCGDARETPARAGGTPGVVPFDEAAGECVEVGETPRHAETFEDLTPQNGVDVSGAGAE